MKGIRPRIITWHGVKMIANHSFLSTVNTICKFSMKRDVVKIGIIGTEGTGKSSMSAAIGHCVHKIMKDKYKINFAVKIYYEEDLLNFKDTIKALTPTNYVLIFDDVSFMEGSAQKHQIVKVKQAVTKIRHLEGGQDVKIILIYNYHYTMGFDKYLRQSDFKYFTTVGSSELENMEKIVKSENMRKVRQFIQFIDEGLKKDFWRWPLSPKEFFKYDWQQPFQPALFFDNIGIRHIITPLRNWIDPACTICANAKGLRHTEKPVKEVIEDGSNKFGSFVFKAAVKLKLFENGLNTYGKSYTQAKRWLDQQLANKVVSFEDIMVHYGLKLTKTRVDKQYRSLTNEDQLKEKDDNVKEPEGLH